MPSQNRGFHSISGLWPLSAVAAFLLLIPTLALGQEERPAPRAVPRVPIYDPGTPVQKKVLKNGVTILVQEQRTSERVAGAVAARMGTVYESDDDAGRGQVLIKAMIAGTQKLKPVELALRLLAADAKLEAGVGPDLGQIAITTKREQVDQAIDLLSQVVLEPAFPDTAVDASRQRPLRPDGRSILSRGIPFRWRPTPRSPPSATCPPPCWPSAIRRRATPIPTTPRSRSSSSISRPRTVPLFPIG